MKANPRNLATVAPWLVAAAAALALTSCSDRRVIPAPAPSAAPQPGPAPAPVRTSQNWRDTPITPGDWVWSANERQSTATFASGQLILRCNLPERTVTLFRAGSASGNVPMTVVTETTARPLTATAQSAPTQGIAVTLGARDPVLDAMAFSRGRFAVEATGLAPLYVPSWPEVSRVIEDCR